MDDSIRPLALGNVLGRPRGQNVGRLHEQKTGNPGRGQGLMQQQVAMRPVMMAGDRGEVRTEDVDSTGHEQVEENAETEEGNASYSGRESLEERVAKVS